MKNILRYLTAALGIVTLLASCEKTDYPDRFRPTDGVPKVSYVRYAEKDVFISQAYMAEVICIVGENLRSVHQILFNDQSAILNTAYMTDNTLVVTVPSTQAQEVDNQIHLITKDGKKTNYEFKVLPPAPRIKGMSNEWAKPGEKVSLYGSFFMDVTELTLPGAAVTGFTVVSSEEISFTVPEGASAGPVSITTASGSANSAFHYLDQRNILFDFDGTRGGFAAGNGWRAPAAGHIHAPGDDAFPAIDGNYMWFGGQDGGLKADPTAVWGEDPYSFNYWNSTDASSSIPPLNTLPTFSTFLEKYGLGGLTLKFECLVPSSNPWMTCSMQIYFTRSSDVSNENMTNAYLSDESLPRALWTPWLNSGSYDTADSWVTVSVPLSTFIYAPNGSTCSTTFDSSFLDGFSMFVWSGYGGKDCDPVLAIDNISVVPM